MSSQQPSSCCSTIPRTPHQTVHDQSYASTAANSWVFPTGLLCCKTTQMSVAFPTATVNRQMVENVYTTTATATAVTALTI